MRRGCWLTGALAVAGAGVYVVAVRPWARRWGATPEEALREMPGDDLVPDARDVTTRAVTIDAPPAAVWPWLVQMGQGRGGLYSYDWLENLFGLDFHSAESIIPELQGLRVGETISLAPDNAMPLVVMVLEPERALVIRTCDRATGAPLPPGDYPKGEIAGSWAWMLEPLPAERTRLVARWRSAWRPSPAVTIFQALVLEPAQFIMERRMLLGIKARAERAWREEAMQPTAAPDRGRPVVAV